jgi:hypothetical protein
MFVISSYVLRIVIAVIVIVFVICICSCFCHRKYRINRNNRPVAVMSDVDVRLLLILLQCPACACRGDRHPATATAASSSPVLPALPTTTLSLWLSTGHAACLPSTGWIDAMLSFSHCRPLLPNRTQHSLTRPNRTLLKGLMHAPSSHPRITSRGRLASRLLDCVSLP